jgi:serine/threonine protein kinase
VFQSADIKSWTAMSLRGLEYIHRNGVLHRVSGTCQSFVIPTFIADTLHSQDLKPNNLLIASNGELKIADFGLAREFGDAASKMTCQVITRCVSVPLKKAAAKPLLTPSAGTDLPSCCGVRDTTRQPSTCGRSAPSSSNLCSASPSSPAIATLTS